MACRTHLSLLLAAACAGVVPPRPNPPTAPLVSTTVGHIEHIAADDPACAHAQSLWQRTVEEFTRTRRVPAIPTDPAVEDCR